MILVQKINIEWRQNFALIKQSKMSPLVDSPAKTLRMHSRFSALSIPSTSEAKTTVSNSTQCELFIGDGKKYTVFGVTYSFN